MSKIIFISMDPESGRSVELKVDGNQTWMALSEEFLNFLKGCGFIVSHEDFAEYWEQFLERDENYGDEFEFDSGYNQDFDFADGDVELGPIDLGPIDIGGVDIAGGITMATDTSMVGDIDLGTVTVSVYDDKKD